MGRVGDVVMEEAFELVEGAHVVLAASNGTLRGSSNRVGRLSYAGWHDRLWWGVVGVELVVVLRVEEGGDRRASLSDFWAI